MGTSDLVIEIGAGTGTLTAELARATRQVHAIEVDPYLVDRLRQQFTGTRNIELLAQDFFAVRLPSEPYAVFANVPFNRTADVVRHLTSAPNPPSDAYLVLQAEAAARFAGLPYGSESVASLSLKPWWHLEVEHWFRRTDFSPPPSVDSVLLHLAHRARPLIEDQQRTHYLRFIEAAFGAGDIGRTLRRRYPHKELRLLADRLRFDRRAPPSALSLEQWLVLFRHARAQAR